MHGVTVSAEAGDIAGVVFGGGRTRQYHYYRPEIHPWTLVVDIWDARTKQLLWRATATDTVSENPEKNEKKLKKAMEKMFKKYPPQKKK
jgi:hypothetical protein